MTRQGQAPARLRMLAARAVNAFGLADSLNRMRPAERLARHSRVIFYRQFIRPRDLVFDVGANMGNRVEAFLALGARVVAVDPQAQCVHYLQRRFGNRISVVNSGLGASTGTATLHLSNAHTTASMSENWITETMSTNRFEGVVWNRKIAVPVTTIDRLISQHGTPQFCKIDVEGYELEVLRGLSQPIRSLSFEFTPDVFDVTRGCIAHLESLSRYRYSYSVGESMVLATQWTTADDLLRQLEVYLDTLYWGDVYATLAQ